MEEEVQSTMWSLSIGTSVWKMLNKTVERKSKIISSSSCSLQEERTGLDFTHFVLMMRHRLSSSFKQNNVANKLRREASFWRFYSPYLTNCAIQPLWQASKLKSVPRPVPWSLHGMHRILSLTTAYLMSFIYLVLSPSARKCMCMYAINQIPSAPPKSVSSLIFFSWRTRIIFL